MPWSPRPALQLLLAMEDGAGGWFEAHPRRVLERGMARGEFRVLDLDCAVHAVLAPMIFLSLCRHSAYACMPAGGSFCPQRYIDTQVDILLGGLCAMPPAPAPAPLPTLAALPPLA